MSDGLVGKEIKVVSRADHSEVKAKLAVCPECKSETWLVYFVNGHPHLQCSQCDETYCQGEGCKL